MIHFQHVTKSFQENWKALTNVTLKIDKGEFVFLTGHSGAGKSTLLKHIYMELKPDEHQGGQVIMSFSKDLVYDSKTAQAGQIQRFRRKLGIVFQDFKLLEDRDVFENIAFALRIAGVHADKIKGRVYEVMQLTGIGHRRNSMPHTLSGGEKQRVAIARAIANEPSVLIADEPTGNLDPENATKIFDILRAINQSGCTVVMATHNPLIYGNHNIRRIILDQGEIKNKHLI
tara:strand:+ start:548 stop:1237 length:690 start_codon:yes stop_codon:yes gene_type:complete